MGSLPGGILVSRNVNAGNNGGYTVRDMNMPLPVANNKAQSKRGRSNQSGVNNDNYKG